MFTHFIINPVAAHGKTRERWRAIETTLRAENFAFDYAFTERPLHAIELTRAALSAGAELVVAVGGDGTLNEVANGMFGVDGAPINPRAALGIIPSSSGGDFARTIGIPRGPIAAAQHLARTTRTRPIDIGEMLFTRDGQPARRFFVNVAGMGFDAEVALRVEANGKRVGGTLPYYSALLTTIWKYRNKDARIQMDDTTIEGRFNAIVICNAKYFGGGMQISPNSDPADGLLEVITLGDLGRLEVVLNTPRLYNGTILQHPQVREYHTRVVTVEAHQEILIEADGELIGPGPATFRIRPAAIRLRA